MKKSEKCLPDIPEGGGFTRDGSRSRDFYVSASFFGNSTADCYSRWFVYNKEPNSEKDYI